MYKYEESKQKMIISDAKILINNWDIIHKMILMGTSDKFIRHNIQNFNMDYNKINNIYYIDDNGKKYLDKTWINDNKQFSRDMKIGIDNICEFNNCILF